MNIVLPYRHEVSDGLEMKFALRSIEKYLTGYGEIFIIGDRFPTWVQNVNLITYSEPKAKSSKNIYNKIKESFNHAGSPILQWQDDIYLQRPLDVKDIKYWFHGCMQAAIKRSHGNYKTICNSTALKTTDAFPYFDIHAPIIYDKVYFEWMSAIFDWNNEYLVKTAYCFTKHSYGQLNQYPLEDCKIGVPTKLHEPEEKIKGKLFFSTGPQGFEPHVIDLLYRLYPEKSKYEL